MVPVLRCEFAQQFDLGVGGHLFEQRGDRQVLAIVEVSFGQLQRQRQPAKASDQRACVVAETPCSRVEQPDTFFGRQGVQPNRRMVKVLSPGGDKRVYPSTDRQVWLQRHILGEIVEDNERRSRKPAQATPDLLHLLSFI